jgi:hypothetical protein
LRDIQDSVAYLIDGGGIRHAGSCITPAPAFPLPDKIRDGHEIAVAGRLRHTVTGASRQQILRAHLRRVRSGEGSGEQHEDEDGEWAIPAVTGTGGSLAQIHHSASTATLKLSITVFASSYRAISSATL